MDGCVAYHAKAAARHGATADEVAETLGVALLMDGGTASVNSPRAWQAFAEFAGQTPRRCGPSVDLFVDREEMAMSRKRVLVLVATSVG